MAVVLRGLTVAVAGRSPGFQDQLLTEIAQRPASGAMDIVMSVITTLGTLEVTLLLMIVLAVTAGPRSRLPMWERLTPLGVFVVLNAVEFMAKGVVPQQSSPLALHRGLELSLTGAVHPVFSYPSGHVMRGALVFGIVGLRLYRRTGLTAWLLVFGGLVWMIAFSRVCLATHWSTDMAGGLQLGGFGLGICHDPLTRGRRGTLDDDSGGGQQLCGGGLVVSHAPVRLHPRRSISEFSASLAGRLDRVRPTVPKPSPWGTANQPVSRSSPRRWRQRSTSAVWRLWGFKMTAERSGGSSWG
jgi:membrane-associated phospholipid phosphatase